MIAQQNAFALGWLATDSSPAKHSFDIIFPKIGEILSDSQTLVVKLGTSVLTGRSPPEPCPYRWTLASARDLHRRASVVIVTSGAVPPDVSTWEPRCQRLSTSKQLLAAWASRLIQLWEQLFSNYGIHVGSLRGPCWYGRS